MVGRDSKFKSVFSWADEVEKEEEEEKEARGGQAEVQQKEKPNPFGSARPREVVLQERGTDWRQLDLHVQVQQPSPSSRNESQNEKLQKQSNPYSTSTATILNSENPVKFRGSPLSPTMAVLSQVTLTPQIQIQSPISFLPPLKYPPKYVAGFLYQPEVSTTSLNVLDSGYQPIKFDKENRFQGATKFQNLKNESAMCGNIRRTKTELIQAKEKQQKGRNRNRDLGESVVYVNKSEVDSATRKEKFHSKNLLGLPLVTQNVGPFEMKDKRRPVKRWQSKNIQDDLYLGRTGTASQVSENKAMEDKWQNVTRKVQNLSEKQVNNGGKHTADRKIKGDSAGLERTNKKKIEKKQIKLKDLEIEQRAY